MILENFYKYLFQNQKPMLRKIRLTAAIVFFVLITLLFLDFTGTLYQWLGWTARIQLLPAILALNTGVFVTLIVFTLIFGRVYCSVICPLGIFQDVLARIVRAKKKAYSFTKDISWLRYSILTLFILCLIIGFSPVITLLDPYSLFGRIANNHFAPFLQWGDNLLAYFAERANSYLFYKTDVWVKSIPTFIIAVITFITLAVLVWRNGRTYCNSVCPVGTVLGFLSRYSVFRIAIDAEKCNKCSLCARSCKSACIDSNEYMVDRSRCVACMNCIGKCKKEAISYKPVFAKKNPGILQTEKVTVTSDQGNKTRRGFLTVSAIFALSSLLKAQEKKVDGGLAVIAEKKKSVRNIPILPPGSISETNMKQRCSACQLCVSVCPNNVLRPSENLLTFMQPEMSFERGYCRPECTKCSEVCPSGAIRPITKAQKSSLQIGQAKLILQNCMVLKDNINCNNCERHCPTKAIQMVQSDPDVKESRKIPVINGERCIGCGACETLCPARPFSAIYVEGQEIHRFI